MSLNTLAVPLETILTSLKTMPSLQELQLSWCLEEEDKHLLIKQLEMIKPLMKVQM